jgi:manganese efflux pump family protein
MIYESFSDEEDSRTDFSLKEIIILAIATSIDAFVVGISFALLNTPVIEPAIIIGIVAFILSFIGVNLGKRLGHLFGKEIEIFGRRNINSYWNIYFNWINNQVYSYFWENPQYIY